MDSCETVVSQEIYSGCSLRPLDSLQFLARHLQILAPDLQPLLHLAIGPQLLVRDLRVVLREDHDRDGAVGSL